MVKITENSYFSDIEPIFTMNADKYAILDFQFSFSTRKHQICVLILSQTFCSFTPFTKGMNIFRSKMSMWYFVTFMNFQNVYFHCLTDSALRGSSRVLKGCPWILRGKNNGDVDILNKNTFLTQNAWDFDDLELILILEESRV